MKARIFIMTMLTALTIGTTAVSAEEVIEPVEDNAVSEEVILGDVNSDSVVNVRDCAMIARKLANDKADELSPETADYNRDTLINVRDAASIAHDLNLHFTASKPSRTEHDTNTFEGRKAYINDMVCKIAIEKYHVAEIKADDTVQSDTWYAPTVYIPNEDYYSAVTSVEENGIEGCFPSCYTIGIEDTIADLEKALDMIAERENFDGTPIDMTKQRLRIKWMPIDNGGNYEIYLCYGGEY